MGPCPQVYQDSIIKYTLSTTLGMLVCALFLCRWVSALYKRRRICAPRDDDVRPAAGHDRERASALHARNAGSAGGGGDSLGRLDPELQALEAEICGVGRLGSEVPGGKTGSVSYSVKGDTPMVLSALDGLVSCQSGGMYGLTAEKDVGFVRSERFVTQASGDTYNLIIHKTNNKDGKLEVCSVSVFSGDQFVAYLFSTNDPLAFDNFNCYRGNVSNTSKPVYQSVEQLVFCESKVRINLVMVQRMGSRDFFEAAKGQVFFGHGPMLNILNDAYPALKDPIDARERDLTTQRTASLDEYATSLPRDMPDKERDKAIKKQGDLLKKQADSILKQELLDSMGKSGITADIFHALYLAYFEKKLYQSHDLPPVKNYKLVGRGLCAVGTFLTIFERLSLMCVLSARMRQLRLSQPERSLVSALVPGCVAECSKDDGLWGYQVDPDNTTGQERKLSWLATADGDARLVVIVDDATKFQDSYITCLSELTKADDIDGAEAFLFKTHAEISELRKGIPSLSAHRADASPHLLGLSERLLQSLWTKQLTFPDALVGRIRERLLQYGIGFDYYVPDLLKRVDENALTIARSIGHR